MPLDVKSYDVAVARDGLDLDKAVEAGEGSGYDLHRVTVFHADRLVAEQAAQRYGLPADMKAQAQHYVTLWVWAALRRSAVEVPEFPLFKPRCLDITPVTAAPETVDPTTPGPDTGSP